MRAVQSLYGADAQGVCFDGGLLVFLSRSVAGCGLRGSGEVGGGGGRSITAHYSEERMKERGLSATHGWDRTRISSVRQQVDH